MARLIPACLIAALALAGLASAQDESSSGESVETPPDSISAMADLTRASGEYLKSVQEARLLREISRQKALETDRKRIEHQRYLESIRDTAPRILARERAAELEHARLHANEREISSGSTLNVLLRSLQQADQRGPTVMLSPEVIRQINLRGAASDGCPALFKNGVRIHWPEALEDEAFDGNRDRLVRGLRHAVATLKHGDDVPMAVLRGIRADHKAMDDLLEAKVSRLSPTQFIQARRTLLELKGAIRGLSGPEAARHFSTARQVQGETVAELVEHMTSQGLVFAAATPGEESAYRAVYLALRRYEERVLTATR